MTSDYLQLRKAAGANRDRSEIVWVTGKDASSFLDGLLSQNIAAMSPGAARPALLLAPNGKLRATVWALRGDQRVGLVVDAGIAIAVVSDLTRFKIRVDVQLAIEERPIWDVWGPVAAEIDTGLSTEGSWSEKGGIICRLPFRYSALPRILVVGQSPPVPLVPVDVVDAVRIEVGEPVMGVDLTNNVIPQEIGDISRSVDFTKGCYLGQELVARIDSRGHVNRRLRSFLFDTAEVPPVGGEVFHDGRQVGSLSSAGFSEGLATAIGLGMIRAEVPDDGMVTVGGHRGVVHPTPLLP